MNQHDRFFAAQRINLTPREERGFPRSPMIAARHRRPAGRFRFLAGVVVGAALAFTWDAHADPVQRHIEAYERYTTDISHNPCLDRAHFALSVANAKQRGMPLTEAMNAVRGAAEKHNASARETSEMIALVLRVWAQRDAPEAAFDREFLVCARGETGI